MLFEPPKAAWRIIMTKKSIKRILSSFLAITLVLTLVISLSATASAQSGSLKVPASGKKMSIALKVGRTGDSSTVTFRVSGLPTNAIITKLQVNPGSLSSYSGAMRTNYLTITSSSGRSEQITWLGAAGKTLTTSKFLASKANGTYTISFNCTCSGGAFVNGVLTDIGTKTYSNPYIELWWDDTL